MNHKKVKKQINKISSFYNSITADDEISKIEKDLLLSYVRKLYEAIVDNDASPITKNEKTLASAKVVVVEEEVVNTPAVMREVVETPVVAERKPFEKAAPKAVATIIEEKPKATPVQDAVQSIAAAPAVAEVIDRPSRGLSENMNSIFEVTGGTEISDKLSNLPIKDLTKSMGINERMFTVKELFGGDQNKFNTILQDLNGLSNFEEAKSYLLDGIATELQWDDASKYKKADKFVKLVQRRFR